MDVDSLLGFTPKHHNFDCHFSKQTSTEDPCYTDMSKIVTEHIMRNHSLKSDNGTKMHPSIYWSIPGLDGSVSLESEYVWKVKSLASTVQTCLKIVLRFTCLIKLNPQEFTVAGNPAVHPLYANVKRSPSNEPLHFISSPKSSGFQLLSVS